MPQPPADLRDFESLKYIIECLRGPDGCPWDREQTHQTLSRFAIEEAFELAEAIEIGNLEEMKGELGDVLFQVLLHSEIAKQAGLFQLEDVIETLSEKMVRRHPHVFTDQKVKNIDEVFQNWAEIKAKEKAAKNKKEGLFPTPKGLPALQESLKIGEKTRDVSFDWQNAKQVLEKVEEEFNEVKVAMESGDSKAIQHELGDLLFSIAQLARQLKVDPEQALRTTNQRFRARFQGMLDIGNHTMDEFRDLKSEAKEKLWDKAKKMETKD